MTESVEQNKKYNVKLVNFLPDGGGTVPWRGKTIDPWRPRPMAAATGAVEITWPIAAIAMAYILGQAAVDAWGEG